MKVTNTVLTMFGKGVVTLPKSFRDRYKTKYFIAQEVAGGMLIQPLVFKEPKVTFRNNKKEIGLSFNPGVEAKQLLKEFKQINGEV